MNVRTSDPFIPVDEELYRRLRLEYYDGNQVLFLAVDLEGTSVDRSSHSKPAESIARGKPEENGLAAIRVDEFPGPTIPLNGVDYEYFAVDLPVPGNDAHAEIRARRVGDRPSVEARKPGSKGAKEQLRTVLARKMRVLVAPSPVVPPPANTAP